MSEELRKMLKRHEGVKNFVYLCSEGYETIGVGRNIADSGLGLSDDEVDYLLDNDIKRVKDELNDEYYWFGGLSEVRQHAMIDISFNLGQTRLRGFKKALRRLLMLWLLKIMTALLMSLWTVDGPNRLRVVLQKSLK